MTLHEYIECAILPQYDNFDGGHQRDHAQTVIAESIKLARTNHADEQMAYVIAAYHDLGLRFDRETHHIHSGEILMADDNLRQWFTEDQIDIMADAAEDHRASSDHEPRSIYGRIVAEADRFIDADTIIRRTIQFGFDHYPSLSPDEHFQRMVSHLREKYGRGGYLHLWFDDSPNALRLKHLQDIIDDKEALQRLFNQYFKQEKNEHSKA